MKLYKYILLSLILTLGPLCTSAQMLQVIVASGTSGGGGGTFTCGNTITTGTTPQSGVDVLGLYTPCTTGANGPGYTVLAMYFRSGASGGKVYSALYSDTTSCTGGQSHCPNNKICSDTSGVTVVANDWTTNTASGCGTLAANTTYWIGQQSDNASREVVQQTSSNCPAPLAYTGVSNYTSSAGGGTWPTPLDAAANATTGCYVQYMTLTLL